MPTTRGPHVAKRRWRDAKTGEWKESSWYFLYYFQAGKKVIKRTDPPTTSKTVAREQLWAALGGKAARPAPEATYHEVIDDYRAHLEAHSPSTLSGRKHAFRWLRARFEEHPTLADTSRIILDLRAIGKQDGTIAGYLGILKAAYRRAVRAKQIPPHELCDIQITLQSPIRTSVWTDDEIDRVCSFLRPETASLVRFLRETGIRLGDALTLRWESIHCDVLRRVQQKTGAELHIPLSRSAMAILSEIPRTGPLVFGGVRKQVRLRSNVGAAVRRAMKRAGVTGRTIHDLRRTLASDLTNTGTPDRQIAALLGQKSTRIVGRYAHSEIESLRASLERTKK